MIFNTTSAGKPEQTKTATPSLSQQTISPDSGMVLSGVIINPITAALLTSLDADFTAANIAENVNVFGLIGSLKSGTPAAYGTITGSGTTTQTISGLPFRPTQIYLVRDGIAQNAGFPANCAITGCAIYGVGSGGVQSASGSIANYYYYTMAFTSDSVSLTTAKFGNDVKWSGTYRWLAIGE